ncbi:MAG: tetratricopeptide repeat protein, partial [Acidobacteriota bacterium]
MMHSDLRPLPHFHLPVAFLRWWPAAGGPNLGARLESLGSIPSLERLDESLLAIVPRNGRAALFDTALQVAWALLGDHSEPRSDLPGVLLFPGRVLDTGDELRPIEDPFVQDLEQRAPTLAPGIPVVTGYGASWLRGHYELTDAGSYEAESGRRVPLFRVVQKRHQLLPWHNPELLGRRVRIPRSVDATLDQTLSLPVVLATGPLGVGKGFSIWHRLLNKPGPQIWVDFAATLPDRPVLTQELLRRLPASADLAASADGPLTDDPEDEAQRLVSHLTSAKEAVGERLWLVCDATQAASGFDLELLGHMLREPRLLQSCRLIVIEREGRAHPSFQDLPRVRIPAMSSSEAGRLAERLFEGLEIHPPVQERLLEAAAGYPFALEEGLTRLVHRGLMRRIYGSFFFAGGEDTAYEPSERLIRHVEAEVRRLGEPLPLRLLAAAGEPISAAQLQGASAHFGIDLPTEWARPWMDAGWIRFTEDAQNNLAFACPAFGAALLRTLAPDGEQSLRHALGGVLADSGQNSGWRAYRLLAGSPEALPSLLDFNRDSGIGVPREEVFNALWSEYRDHRARRADEATELEILWSLLPLARRLGCLSQLETELRRAVELAEGQDQRYVALVALKAELDQEMGRFYEAEQGLRLALASSEGFDEKRRATLFLRLGAMLHREERWNEARRIFRQLLSVVEEGSSLAAMCNFYLGNIALQERQLDEAESLHRLALDVRHGKG